MTTQAGYYRHPTLHGEAVVFVCEDDLWTVSSDGGVARRLTANPGRTSFPVFSPDGTKIAFTGQEEGPSEVYVMDAAGGPPKRLTWLGHWTQTVGWRPDGSSVIFASDWRQMRMGLLHLAQVASVGGAPAPLDLGPARAISFAPRGQGVVLGRNSGDPARWKRYRGGTAGTIWIDRSGRGAFQPLLDLEGNLASPMWIDGRIYFLSDHEGHGNLYSCSPQGQDLTRHTDHEDYYVRFPTTDGQRIVYHAGADLYLFDPAVGQSRRLDIHIRSPRTHRNRRFVDPSRSLESFHLHPEGHSAALVVRGGAFTMGLWDGPVVRHGQVSSERRRLAAWLADGKRLVSVSDRSGEEALVVETPGRSAPPRQVAADVGRVVDLLPSPHGPDRVALTNHRQELLLVDVARRTRKRVAQSDHDRIQGMAWSPDGRWLAYALPMTYKTTSLRIYDTRSGKSHTVTRSDFSDVRPSFDPEGRYLYFISWRVFDPVYDSHYFDLGFPRGARPYLVTLQKDRISPFDAANRDPRLPMGTRPPEGMPPGALGKTKKRPPPPEVRIDFAGIEDRVVAIPVPEGRYLRVGGVKGRILMSSLPVQGSLSAMPADVASPPAKANLEFWDFEKEKRETLVAGMTDFEVSADGQVLGIRVGNGLRVVSAAAGPEDLKRSESSGRASGWVDLGRVRAEVRPGDEWAQMYREAWRLQRDQFWTPDMSGVSWQGVHDRYLPLVARVGCRSEFSDLIWEMQGELGTSHCYEMGGDYAPVPAWHQGFLGADLVYQPRTRSWHVARIPRGDAWDETHASPLAAPGLGIAAGDRLVAVDGTAVGRERTPYECLVYRAGQVVRLTLKDKAGKERTLQVRAAAGEHGLRYRDWVEANREAVHTASGNKVGYVHVPDMGPNGYAEFHRYYRNEVDRPGLIVDVRFNGGGHVSQLILEKLLRRRIGYDKTRWQKEPMPYPDVAPMGPMVALTNEYAGSDGDIFSHSFKVYGLGPLIGKRTWGGVVGIWPRHALVDGSWTTQPEFSYWFADVGWEVENYGVAPDIEVDVRPQDYRAGKDPQLERALKEIARLIREQKPRLPDFGTRPDRRPPRLPPARR